MVNRYQNLPLREPRWILCGQFTKAELYVYMFPNMWVALRSESVMVDATRGYKHTQPAKTVVFKN